MHGKTMWMTTPAALSSYIVEELRLASSRWRAAEGGVRPQYGADEVDMERNEASYE
jgi:hypothetical protein